MKHIHLEKVDSTNREISRRIREQGLREDLVLSADFQEAGLGQAGNEWSSEAGSNVLMSLLLHPAFLSAPDQFTLSQVASLALTDLLFSLGLEARIKWPNDTLCGPRKIAGILIENGITGTSLTHCIIGIGLNVNQETFDPFPVPATSLALEGCDGQRPERLVRVLSEKILHRYDQLRNRPLNALNEEYLGRLFGYCQSHVFASETGTFDGVIQGITRFGELLVETGGVTQAYGFREIKLIPGRD